MGNRKKFDTENDLDNPQRCIHRQVHSDELLINPMIGMKLDRLQKQYSTTSIHHDCRGTDISMLTRGAIIDRSKAQVGAGVGNIPESILVI